MDRKGTVVGVRVLALGLVLPAWAGVPAMDEKTVVDEVEEEENGEDTDDEAGESAPKRFSDVFTEDRRDLGPTGENPYFVLKPGYFLKLRGREEDGVEEIRIDVTDRTVTIDGIEARIVEERCWEDGQLVEVALDYFAISKRTGNVYYLGEDVDNYKDGKVADHDGTWRSGKNGARFGLMMPGEPVLGARYHQEVAPGVALDRAEVVGLFELLTTPAGAFKDVLVTEETNPLKAGERERKRYARGVGLVQDGGMKLVEYGWNRQKK